MCTYTQGNTTRILQYPCVMMSVINNNKKNKMKSTGILFLLLLHITEWYDKHKNNKYDFSAKNI